jgi:hypothetical protein
MRRLGQSVIYSTSTYGGSGGLHILTAGPDAKLARFRGRYEEEP